MLQSSIWPLALAGHSLASNLASGLVWHLV